jgi:hypothetical protein
MVISLTEYINRQKLLQTLNENKIPYNADVNYFITNAPVADVVEVVRCKDCQHYIKDYHRCSLHSEEPDQYSTGFIFEMQEDDFCSCGERRLKNE